MLARHRLREAHALKCAPRLAFNRSNPCGVLFLHPTFASRQRNGKVHDVQRNRLTLAANNVDSMVAFYNNVFECGLEPLDGSPLVKGELAGVSLIELDRGIGTIMAYFPPKTARPNRPTVVTTCNATQRVAIFSGELEGTGLGDTFHAYRCDMESRRFQYHQSVTPRDRGRLRISGDAG